MKPYWQMVFTQVAREEDKSFEEIADIAARLLTMLNTSEKHSGLTVMFTPPPEVAPHLAASMRKIVGAMEAGKGEQEACRSHNISLVALDKWRRAWPTFNAAIEGAARINSLKRSSKKL